MHRLGKTSWPMLVMLFIAVVASADYLEVARTSSIEAKPSRRAAVLKVVEPGEFLTLLDGGRQVSGYYHVQIMDSARQGWIYRNRVRRHRGKLPASSRSDTTSISVHSIHCIYGCPTKAISESDLIFRESYTLFNNGYTKFADWVAYRLDKSMLAGGGSLGRQWRSDPWLPQERTLEPPDYEAAHKQLGVDRGHQAPLASLKGSYDASETNFLSNITPQSSNLNRGPWAQLERWERALAKEQTIYVVTGPIYARQMPSLPKASKPHQVPSGYWKIIIIPAQDLAEVRAASFFFEQSTPREDKFISHLTSIDNLEVKTGLDFLWELDDKIEAAIERKRAEWVRPTPRHRTTGGF